MDIKQIVIECLKEYGIIIQDEIDENTPFTDYGMDSLIYMMLICDLEENLSKEFLDYSLLSLENMSVSKLVSLIEN